MAITITFTMSSNPQIAFGEIPTINSLTVNSNDSLDLICTDNPLSVVTGRLVRIDNDPFTSIEVDVGGAGDTTSIICDGITVNNVSFTGFYSDFDVINLRLRIFDGDPAASSRVDTTFIVADNTQPVITLVGTNPQIINLTNPYIEQGATALDNIDGDISSSIIIDSSSVITGTDGVYFVTYDVTDSSSNAAVQVIRTVIVLDNIIPVIALNGDSLIEIPFGSVYIDQGATAFDIDDGNLTSSIVTVNPVNTLQQLTTFIITYDVVDNSGNPAVQVIRTVKIGAAPTHDCTNCQSPSIGVTERGQRVVDGGITVNGNTVDANFYFTPFPLVQANIGEPITVHFVIWDDRADNIAHVELGLGKEKTGESFQKESSLIWNRNVMTKQSTITYDESAFDDVVMEMTGKTACRVPSNGYTCDLFKVQFTPVKAIVGDVVFGVSIWDDRRNSMTTFFNEGLQVGTEADVIPEIEFVAPEGKGNRSIQADNLSDNVMTRISPQFNLVKQYELDRANEMMKSLFPELFAEEKHSETIKVYLEDSLNIDDSIDTETNSQ